MSRPSLPTAFETRVLRDAVEPLSAGAAEAPSTPGASAARAVEHLQFLDGARGVAASYVVLHHAMYNVPYDPRLMLLLKFFQYGHFAVDIFIVLSGYCLMLPVARRREPSVDFWPFIRRRALRIVPTYYIALLGCWALIATVLGERTGQLWDRSVPVSGYDALLHFALVHEWFPVPSSKFNYVFWSVGVEWKIYFLFPLLVLLRSRRGPWVMALGSFVVGYALWGLVLATNVGNPSPWGSSPYYIGLFALGMLAADLADKRTPQTVQRARRLFQLLSLAIVGLVVYEQLAHTAFMLQLWSALIGSWAATTLFLLREGTLPTLRRLLAGRLLVALGAMGYSLYLVHAPILQLVYQADPTLHSGLMLLASAAATLLVARLFYLVAERPFHTLSRRF